MTGEYENPLFLEEWLKSRIKYQQEELVNTEKYKETVKNINFSWYNLKGKLVIENFPKLTCLNLGHNELEEIEIRNCPKLQNIIVSHNQKIVYETKEFEYKDKYNEEPYIKKEQISSEVEPTLTKLTITDCPEVRELYASDNRLTDLDVSELKNLKVLSYSDNPLSSSKKTELDDLGLDKENPTDNPIKVLNNDDFIDNEEITEIDISNEAGWEGKLEVKNCPKLTSLVVDNCGLEKLVIEGCPNLKTLSFRFNKIKNIGLTRLNNLEELYLSDNELWVLDLCKNVNLKHLVCDNNPIEELEVKHLKDLESLYCFKCHLEELDVSDLKKLEELYCANSMLCGLNIDGCDNLEILDCAENFLGELIVEDKPKLETISCKENNLVELTINNCPLLGCLDFSRQRTIPTKLILVNSNGLKKVFHDKNAKVSKWEDFPQIELLSVGEIKKVEVKDEKTGMEGEEFVYFVEIIDFLALRSIQKIEEVIANPNDYSIDDIIKLDLYGVPDNLREKLKVLVINKIKAAETSKANFLLTNKQNLSNFLRIIYLRSLNLNLLDQETEDKVIALIAELEKSEKDPEDSGDENPNSKKPSKVPTPQKPEEPTPPDKDQLINDLKEKIAKLQKENESLKNRSETQKTQNQRKIEEIRKEIINSQLSEEQKQELLKQLEELTKKTTNEVEISPSTPLHYWGWLFVIVGWIVLVGLLIKFLQKEKKRNL